MRRKNYLIGVAVVFIATLSAVLTGCIQGHSSPGSGRRAAVSDSGIASNDLPEVVITASRPQPKRIVLSARDSGAASH
jgi:hypothetical protein